MRLGNTYRKGRRYEKQIPKFLGKLGFHVPKLDDTIKLKHAEIDAIAQKDGRTYLIEAKNWNRPVDTSVVRGLIKKMDKTGHRYAMLVAKNDATDHAKELASKHRIDVHENRGDLVEQILTAKEETEKAINRKVKETVEGFHFPLFDMLKGKKRN